MIKKKWDKTNKTKKHKFTALSQQANLKGIVHPRNSVII